MRIKEISIDQYEVLRNIEKLKLGSLVVIFGKNESGKTLLLEAILKFLFPPSKRGEFPWLERVEDEPDGELKLEVGGNTYTFPPKRDFVSLSRKVLEKELTPKDFRNIFVIRDSDLHLHKEGEFYTNFSSRLLGIQTEEIEKLKERVREICQVTPKFEFKSDRQGNRLKERIEKGRKLKEEMEEFIKKLEERGVEKLEKEETTLRLRIEEKQKKLEEMKKLQQKSRYLKAKKAYEECKALVKELKELSNFNSGTAREWEGISRELSRLKKEKKNLEEELEGKKKESQGLKKELQRLEEESKLLENLKGIYEEYRKLKEDLSILERKKLFFNFCPILSFVSLILGLTALFWFRKFLFALPFFIVFIFSFSVILFLGGTRAKKEGRLKFLEESWEKIFREKYNLCSLGEWEFKIQELQTGQGEKEKILHYLEGEIQTLERRGEEIIKQMEKLERKVEELKTESGVENEEEYHRKLKEKAEKEKILKEKEGILSSFL